MEEQKESPNTEVCEDGFEIIARKGWMALPLADGKPLASASYLMYGHTKTYSDKLRRNVHCYDCTDSDSNKEKVRVIQDLDSRFFGDIRFSFLIGADGKVYEGRGWNLTPSLPKKYHIFENQSLYIAMLEPLPDATGIKEMLRTRNELIKYGVTHGYINANCVEVTMNNKYFWPHFRKFLSRM